MSIDTAEYRKRTPDGLDLPLWFTCRTCGVSNYKGAINYTGYGMFSFTCAGCLNGSELQKNTLSKGDGKYNEYPRGNPRKTSRGIDI